MQDSWSLEWPYQGQCATGGEEKSRLELGAPTLQISIARVWSTDAGASASVARTSRARVCLQASRKWIGWPRALKLTRRALFSREKQWVATQWGSDLVALGHPARRFEQRGPSASTLPSHSQRALSIYESSAKELRGGVWNDTRSMVSSVLQLPRGPRGLIRNRVYFCTGV